MSSRFSKITVKEGLCICEHRTLGLGKSLVSLAVPKFNVDLVWTDYKPDNSLYPDPEIKYKLYYCEDYGYILSLELNLSCE